MSIEETIRLFFEQYPQKRYEKGEIIIFADDTIPPVYYLKKGTVAQHTVTEDGVTLALNIFKPGAFFPMSAALNMIPNTYFFEAREACVVHVVPATDAVAFLEQHPTVALDLLKRVYRGTDGILAKLAELMGGNAQARILTELRIAGKRFGKTEPSGDIVINITEAQLAEQTGMARETVSKAIGKLKAAGTIETKRGHITLVAKDSSS